MTEAPTRVDAAPAETPSTPPDPEQLRRDLRAAETAAFEAARPVFQTHCARCHSKANKKFKKKALDHFDMTTYPFGGHHAAEVSSEIREVLGIGGGKATMPMDDPGAVTGDELALITAWADAFDASHQGGAHEDHGDGKSHDHGGHKHVRRHLQKVPARAQSCDEV